MKRFNSKIFKGLFLLSFATISAIIYLLVSIILFNYLASLNHFNKIKEAILKAERLALLDQDIKIERALSINLHLTHAGVFTIGCDSVYVSDLSLNKKLCLAKSSQYVWFDFKTPAQSYLIGFVKEDAFDEFVEENKYLIYMSALVYIFLNSLFIVFTFIIFVVIPTNSLSRELENIVNDGLGHLNGQADKNPILSDLYKSIVNLVLSFSEYKKKEALLDMSRQVAHDVRSPIAILKGINIDESNLSENQKYRFRVGLERIEGISAELLGAKLNESVDNMSFEGRGVLEDLLSIFCEKRIEHEGKKVTFEFHFDPSIGRVSLPVPAIELKRVISNLINNSVDAIDEGAISLKVFIDSKFCKISVIDTGDGVPDSILPLLFSKGNTTKNKGNGLGLFAAKKKLESYGGSVSYERSNGLTIFSILVPYSLGKERIKTEIYTSMYDEILIIEASQKNNGWIKKFENTKTKIINYSNGEFDIDFKSDKKRLVIFDQISVDEVYSQMDSFKSHRSSSCFLCVGNFVNNLDLINNRNDFKISFIPKDFVDFIAINNSRRIVLIDDDKFIRIDWQNFCENKNLDYISYDSIDNFLLNINKHEKEDLVFIDSILKEGVRGEIDSEKIYLKGFKNLFLATSFSPDEVHQPFWIKHVLSKDPRVFF